MKRHIKKVEKSISTMSNIGNSTNYTMAVIVVAFKEKKEEKLLKMCKEEMVKGNDDIALFSILCWMHLVALKKGKLSDMNTKVRDGYSEISIIEPVLKKITQGCDLFNEISEKRSKKQLFDYDTTFFEKKEEDFFSSIVEAFKHNILEGVLQIFFSNSYYWSYDDQLSGLKKVFNSFFTMVKHTATEGKANSIMWMIGKNFLDRAMTFVFQREGIITGKRPANNRVARAKMIHNFLIFFSGNYLFSQETRQKFNERLNVWINVEDYFISHNNEILKNVKGIPERIVEVVGLVQTGMEIERNPKPIMSHIEEKMRQCFVPQKLVT